MSWKRSDGCDKKEECKKEENQRGKKRQEKEMNEAGQGGKVDKLGTPILLWNNGVLQLLLSLDQNHYLLVTLS